MAVDYTDMDDEKFSKHLKFLASALAKNGKEEIAALLSEADSRLMNRLSGDDCSPLEMYLDGSS